MFDAKQITDKFRHVRLELAREKAHPEGDPRSGYDLVIPLDEQGRLDPAEWKAHRDGCRVRRFHDGEEDRIGELSRTRDGEWFFDYAEGTEDNEIGFRLDAERFVPGEYVSIEHDGEMHTYRVKSVEEL